MTRTDWGFFLERNLTDLGYNVEVMNFGVGGYGIDQIYLRWEIEGNVSVNSFLDTFVSQIMLPQPTYNIAHV